MKAIGVNGSPRKKWNTATLLKKALEGAASEGAKTGLVHLYDLDYKGCISCFACKTFFKDTCGFVSVAHLGRKI
jgi:multimeric flavodoxin WrbA